MGGFSFVGGEGWVGACGYKQATLSSREKAGGNSSLAKNVHACSGKNDT